MTSASKFFMGISLLAGLFLPLYPARGDDSVAFSFAFVGCNRLDKAGVDATGANSTANEAQLLQTFADVGTLDPKPKYLFLAGDVVRGVKSGTKKLGAELDAWTRRFHDQLDSSIRLVVFTGNHEMLQKAETPGDGPDNDSDTEEKREIPNPSAAGYWQAVMKPYIFGKNGPSRGGKDNLANDESRLS